MPVKTLEAPQQLNLGCHGDLSVCSTWKGNYMNFKSKFALLLKVPGLLLL